MAQIQHPPQVVLTFPVSQLPDNQSCKLSGRNRPRYQDANKIHDYCGRAHAQKYMVLQQQRSGGKNSEMASQSATDPRDVVRGHCAVCSCFAYRRDESGGPKCSRCDHPPAKHVKKDVRATVSDSLSSQDATMYTPSPDLSAIPVVAARTPPTSSAPVKLHHAWGVPSATAPHSQWSRLCCVPNCSEESNFDPNTGEESPYCYNHQNVPHLPHSRSAANFEGLQAVGIPHFQSTPSMNNSLNPPSDDSSSPMFITDGDTHSRPANVSQICTSHSPSMAQIQQPPQVVLASLVSHLPDDQSCKLSGCNHPRYQDANKTHDYSGRAHAQKYMVLQQQRSGGNNSEMASQSATNSRGIMRGYCTLCSCIAYTRDESGGAKCSRCSHPPAKHVKKDVRVTVSDSLSSQDAAIYTPLSDLSAISVVAARTPPTSSAPVKLHHAWGVPSAASHSQQSYLYQVSKKLHFDPHVNQAQMQARVQGGKSCTIADVAPDTPEFSRVQAHFTSTWDKGSCPQVDYILSVTNAKLESRWKIYRKELRHKDFERHFHGTKLTCNVVSQLSACGGEHCGVCGIAQNGMDGQCIHKNINFQRFGRGFYLAPNSSKCHDYTQTYQLQGPNTHRAMLLCDVLPGNKCYLQKRDPSLTAPPAGYDCVYGQVGGELNYEEIVVYNTESVMPRYVVLYRKDGVHKIAK